jgi:hypothetical protein
MVLTVLLNRMIFLWFSCSWQKNIDAVSASTKEALAPQA